MMFKKIAQLVVALFSLLFFIGCEDNLIELVIEEEQVVAKPDLLLGSIKDFPGLSELVKTEVDDKKAVLQKSIEGETFNFQVVENVVSQLSWGEDFHYTFPITRENEAEERYENLIISNRIGSDPEAYIVEYFPAEGYWQALAEDPNISFRGDARIVPIDLSAFHIPTSSSGCTTTRTITVVKCRYSGHDTIPGEEADTAGPGCTETYTETVTVTLEAECSANGGTINLGGIGGSEGTSDGTDETYPSPGSIEDTSIFLDPMVQGRRLAIKLNLSSFSDAWDWVFNSDNFFRVFQILSFLQKEGDSNDSKDFAKEAIAILSSGTAQQKEFVNAILSNDLDLATSILFQNVEGAEYSPCPNPPCEGNFDAAVVLSVQIVNGFFDGIVNSILFLGSPLRSPQSRGRIVREIMKESSIDVPNDIDNETLGNLFKVRSRTRELTFEPANEDLGDSLSDIGISLLDIVAIVSPSKGGGAFLFVKNGAGKITANSLSNYFKALKRGHWKTVNEAMSDAARSYQEHVTGRSITESFVLESVKFDGLRNGILTEAKSGMLNFIDANTNTFKPFFTGTDAIIDQARRQRIAAGDLPIEWHFEHDVVRGTFENVLKNRGFNIDFKHTPR